MADPDSPAIVALRPLQRVSGVLALGSARPLAPVSEVAGSDAGRSGGGVDGVASSSAGGSDAVDEEAVDEEAVTSVDGGLMYTARGSSIMRGGPITKRSGCARYAASFTS